MPALGNVDRGDSVHTFQDAAHGLPPSSRRRAARACEMYFSTIFTEMPQSSAISGYVLQWVRLSRNTLRLFVDNSRITHLPICRSRSAIPVRSWPGEIGRSTWVEKACK